ncbi:MAG: hypothetical protein BZ136_03770 [Methanosphaera sp. rholeuAM74]|nr:MAG: hypothetical protein BZ136_03770 [Methanosphaera sp. rholeuAM74]
MFLDTDNFETLIMRGKQFGILMLKHEDAEEYLEVPLIKNSESGSLESVGIFLDKHDDIIGINTKIGENIYDSEKIIKKIQSMIDPRELQDRRVKSKPKNIYELSEVIVQDRQTKQELLLWWNNFLEEHPPKKETYYGDVRIKHTELKKHFVESIITSDNEPETVWTSYYISPPCGLEVQIKNTRIDFSENDINQIMMVESPDSLERDIYFYDKQMGWVQSIGIHTTELLSDIEYLFMQDDLKKAATRNNDENQAYIQLYEKLNIYNDKTENRKILRDWYDENKKFLVNLDKRKKQF